MANKWPIISGNWSNPLIWNGLSKPVPGDDVFANNQSLYIDENVTVSTLRNAASASAIVASGSFYLNDGVTVNLTAANAFLATVAPLIIISGSNSARINGNNTGTGTTVAPIIQMTGSATLTMSGSFIGGTGNGNIIHGSSGSLILTGSYNGNGGGSSSHLIYMTAAGSLYLSGSIAGSGNTFGIFKTAGSGSIYIITPTLTSGASGTTINKQSFGDIDVIGNIAAGTGASVIVNSGGGTIRVTGDMRGGGSFFNGITNTGANVLITVTGSVIGVGNTAYGINNAGANSIMIISGSVLGGTSTAAGISIGSNVTLIVTGSVAGSTTAAAIITTTATTIRITGPVSSSIAFPGIQSTSATATNIFTGPFYNVNNRNAVFAPNIQLISGSTPTWTFDTETYSGTKILYTSDAVAGYPSSSNVRQGTVFGNTGQFTGTVVIPSVSNVIRGALVDNGTGSASFTVNNVWSILTSSLSSPNSLGERLRNTSTATTDGILIASKGTL